MILILCVLLLAAIAWSGDDPGAPGRVGPMLRTLAGMPAPERLATLVSLGANFDLLGEDLSVVIDYDGDPAVLQSMGAIIHSRLGSTLTATIPAAAVDTVASLPGLRYIQLSKRFFPMLDASVPDARASYVRSGIAPNWTGYTGKGVVVGTVDTGVDVNNRDFKDVLGKSRILYVWDQTTGTGGGNHPAGYTYGTEWTKAQIDAGQCTERDTGGHGTGVMGIAAGNGAATGNGWPAYRYVGMAPEADIIAVRTTFLTTAIIDGMNYIKARAAALGKPCVINLSVGSQMGAHDGTDPIERAIDQISGQGVVVCTAAGNNGTTDTTRYIHAQLTVAIRNAEATAGINVLSTRTSPFYMDIWYEGDDAIDITVKTPNGYSLTKSTGFTSGGYYATADGGIWIDNSSSGIYPYNSDRECVVQIQNAVAGNWSLTVTGRTVRSGGLCNAWIETNQNVFWSTNGTNSGSCSIPGTSNSVITVGGYRTKAYWTNPDGTRQGWASPLGAFCTYSGEGPTRDGRQKPDLCVPSTAIATSISANSSPSATNIVEDGVHLVMNGTSMAVPHMTGAAALLLQRDPTATAAEIRNYVSTTARADSFTGSVPNVDWGYGKLDVQAAMNITPLYTNISTARIQSDGTPIKLPDQIVTAGLSKLIDRFYIESANRSAGIQVRTGSGSGIQAEKGSKVFVKGVIGVIDGERAVLSPTVTQTGTDIVPDAVALPNRSVGGTALDGRVPGVTNGTGLNNVGLLVKVWGKVTYLGSNYFLIDDGTGLLYASGGPAGLKVSCGTLTKPALNQRAVITGISTIEWDGSVAKPVVRVREQTDLIYY